MCYPCGCITCRPCCCLQHASHLKHADTLIPQPGNLLAWDRYGYAYNNPVIYNDPSGHDVDCGIGDSSIDGLGCRKRVEIEKNISYLDNERSRCAANPGGANCPNYREIATFTATAMVLNGLTSELGGVLSFTDDALLQAGVKCTVTPLCKNILYGIIGVEELVAKKKLNSNKIGNLAVEQVEENLPIIAEQIRVRDLLTGQVRIYDGKFVDSSRFVEIKGSTRGVVYATKFIRNQVSFDGNQTPKPWWIFVNAMPSGHLMKFLSSLEIPWSQLN